MVFFAVFRFFQLGTFVVFVWWAAVVKSISAIFIFIFGPDYRQAMYGKSMKEKSFVLDKSITVTNHGAYGTVPKKVLEARWQFQVIQLNVINLKIEQDAVGAFTWASFC